MSCGLYIFYPIFKDHFFIFKEVFSENFVLMYGLYLRAAYGGARTVIKVNAFFVIIDTEKKQKQISIEIDLVIFLF